MRVSASRATRRSGKARRLADQLPAFVRKRRDNVMDVGHDHWSFGNNDVKGFYSFVLSVPAYPRKHSFDMGHGSIGQNSMTKIEDERAAGERLQDGIDGPIQSRPTCKQSVGI
jgi:hypothetical protein